jgi:hypothetical protein
MLGSVPRHEDVGEWRHISIHCTQYYIGVGSQFQVPAVLPQGKKPPRID